MDFANIEVIRIFDIKLDGLYGYLLEILTNYEDKPILIWSKHGYWRHWVKSFRFFDFLTTVRNIQAKFFALKIFYCNTSCMPAIDQLYLVDHLVAKYGGVVDSHATSNSAISDVKRRKNRIKTESLIKFILISTVV